jgi:hypothetical protein
VTWRPSSAGTYIFATTYHDSTGGQCSGNPYYTYSQYPIYGYSACSNPLSSSSCTVNVIPPASCTSAGPVGNPTISCSASTYNVYAYGVANATSVVFPTWSDVKGQDDIVWYPGTNLGGGTWRATINFANHADTGQFNVHIYMNGNVWCGTANFIRNSCSISLVDAWWQAKDADISTNGSIGSKLPAGQSFVLNGSGGYPGVVSYGASINLAAGTVSSTGWLANTLINVTKIYDSAFFANQIPADTVINDSSLLPSLGGVASNGYYWYRYNGATSGSNFTISSNLNVGNKKVILLVDQANLNINGNISLTDSSGFFMAIVDGHIVVNPTVTDLEGIYEADNQFRTGVSANQLRVRGSVASYGGVFLERDLGAGNATTPSEFFEYAPDQIMLFPPALGIRKMNWKEVAP